MVVGQSGKDLRCPAAQSGREAVLQGGVGPLQCLHSQPESAVLRFQPLLSGSQVLGRSPQHRGIARGVELAVQTVRGGAGLRQCGADPVQLRGDGLPAPDGSGDIRLRRAGSGRLLDLKLIAHPCIPGGGLRLRQLLPPDGTGPEQLVRRGDVEGVGSEAPDLQQDALFVGGETTI